VLSVSITASWSQLILALSFCPRSSRRSIHSGAFGAAAIWLSRDSISLSSSAIRSSSVVVRASIES
jgi:hypothetical protein